MSMSRKDRQALMDYRRANVPIFNDQKLKLGVGFGVVVDEGAAEIDDG